MKMSTYMSEVIKSNSGVSSTRFNLVYVGIACSILLLCVGFVIVYDTIYNGKLDVNLSKLAVFIGSISSVFTAIGATKVVDTFGKNNKK